MDTQELKQVFKLAADLSKFVETAVEVKYLALIGQLPTIVADLKIIGKAKQAFDEYAAMTDAQAADLEAYVATVVTLDAKPIEAVIEQAFNVLIALHGLLQIFKA